MMDHTDLERAGGDMRWRLRVAALLALAAAVVFVPIELAYGARWLLLPWGLHVLLDVAALLGTRSALSARQVDRLVVWVIGGHVANGLLYFALAPRRPGLVADGLTCLLVVGAVFFSWSERRVLLTALAATIGFLAIGIAVAPAHGPTVRCAVAAGALAGGVGNATASARLLCVLRLPPAARHEKRVALTARLIAVQDEDRRRRPRVLHDELAQSLTAVNACLWLIERQPPTDVEALRRRAGEARRLVAETLHAMRKLS